MPLSWRHVLTMLVAASLAAAEVVPARSCDDNDDNQQPAIQRYCAVHEVRVSPCPEAPDNACKIKRGENVSLSFDFTPSTVKTPDGPVYARAYWTSDLVDLPLLGMETNACNFTSCPLKPEEKRTYTYTLPISKFFPVRAYDVKWKLWDDDDMECCFIFPIKLTK